jgi:hypothetical protein
MKAAELFEKVKYKLISPDDFLTEFKNLADGLTRPGVVIRDEKTIYRTRVFLSDTRPNSINELSYPPVEKTTLQRANNIGEQVFYGSFGFNTAFVESRVKVNEFVIISEWVNIEDVVLVEVGLSPEKHALNETNKLLHDIFTWPGEEMYEYSSKLAFHFLLGDIMSGIIYPSISSDFESHNVAIHTDFVDHKMKFLQAYLFHVTDISLHEEYEVNEIAFAVPEHDGILKWENGRTGKLYF